MMKRYCPSLKLSRVALKSSPSSHSRMCNWNCVGFITSLVSNNSIQLNISWKSTQPSPGLHVPMFFFLFSMLWSCVPPLWEHASSPAFATLSSHPPGWAVTPASLQLLHVTNSHPGVIQRMHFCLLYALCPFLKFGPTLRGRRSRQKTKTQRPKIANDTQVI